MPDIQQLIQKYNDIKNQIENIEAGIATHKNRITGLHARLDGFKQLAADTQGPVRDTAMGVYRNIADMIYKYENRLNTASGQYTGIKAMAPHADRILRKISAGAPSLAFNMASVVGITAAGGGVIATVYALSQFLDPVEENINKQAKLLDELITAQISESDYQTRAQALLADLRAKNIGLQASTGINPVVVILGAGAIFLGYLALEKTKIGKKIGGLLRA